MAEQESQAAVIQQKEDAVRSLEYKCENNARYIEELEATNHMQADEIERLKKDLRRCERENNEHKKTISKYDDDLFDAEAERDKAKADLKSQAEKFQIERNSLNARLATRDYFATDSKDALNYAETVFADKDQTISDLKDENKQLSKQLKHIEAQNSRPRSRSHPLCGGCGETDKEQLAELSDSESLDKPDPSISGPTLAGGSTEHVEEPEQQLRLQDVLARANELNLLFL